ncbi:MAG: YeaH/YhbH family protein [Pseudomonadota bacterium]|nr:YeaH/YhbH family protein [Pseudomonadota bacterium]
MTSVIVDRRPDKGKNTGNRQRVLKRLEGALKAQVDQLIARQKLKEHDKAVEVSIERKDVKEPGFVLDPVSGAVGRVVPGNDNFRVGDKIPRDSAPGRGRGAGEGSGQGEADDEDVFRFALSREEYLSLLFDDLELPALVKKDLLEIDESRFRRGGVVRYGNPGTVCVSRTFKASIGRRLAAEAQIEEALEEAEAALLHAQASGVEARIRAAELALREVHQHRANIPFLDPVDLRHRSLVEVESPRTAAVMFCLMDVSSSMDEVRKDLAKRFFTLLYLFLSRKYQKVELVFIRHTDQAQEVDEDTFFNGTQAGSTKVVSALAKMHEIIGLRYPASHYNIFGAQASDGDSFGSDSTESSAYLFSRLLPTARYFVYAEVGGSAVQGSTTLWSAYRDIKCEHFNMAAVRARNEVYPALAKLFKQEQAV